MVSLLSISFFLLYDYRDELLRFLAVSEVVALDNGCLRRVLYGLGSFDYAALIGGKLVTLRHERFLLLKILRIKRATDTEISSIFVALSQWTLALWLFSFHFPEKTASTALEG
jgi:hypothetical protein